jgi:electron transfer flavoprotein beta subunit
MKSREGRSLPEKESPGPSAKEGARGSNSRLIVDDPIETIEAMQIYVCMKHVPDTAANIRPLGGVEFDESVKFIVNPYDEYALEQALLIRESGSGIEVVAVTVGKEAALSTLRTALATGADRAILVRTDRYFTDAIETARLLQRAISQDGSPDLILTGRQSADTEGMQIPYRLGALFDMPVAVNVAAFSMIEGLVTVEREIEGDVREVIEMPVPCIVGATKGLNRPRLATLPDMMKARKKEVRVIPQADLGPAPSVPAVELLELQAVPDRGRGRMLEGSPEEMVRDLLRMLGEDRIL